MDLDDILYFLFLATWVIFGVLRKRKKSSSEPKRRPQANSPEKKPIQSFQDILSELARQAEESREKIYHTTAQPEKIDDYPENQPDTRPDIVPEERTISFPKFDKSAIKSYEGSKSSESELLDDFDLKKAVIYETILNRKYF